MVIDPALCTGCDSCRLYCPAEAIIEGEATTAKGRKVRTVDLERCLECGNCLRSEACRVGALQQQPLEWPRSVRSAFSNPKTEHKSKDMGRGTEEMKTNEITHRFKAGEVGVAIELGRPILGAGFEDVQKVTMAMAGLGVAFEERNPLTSLIEDRAKGTIQKDVLGEKVLSTIVEFKIPEERITEVLPVLRDVAASVQTVFSVCVISVLPDGGPAPVVDRIRKAGFEVRPNGKVNLGLGRPMQE